MLSRAAESIYWMNRYIERAENYARFMDVNLSLIIDLPKNLTEQWQPLVRITGDDALFESLYDAYSRETVVEFLTFNRNNPNSIMSCLIQARENARTVRVIISSEMWHQINELFLSVKNLFDKDPVLVAIGPTGNNTPAYPQTNRSLYDVLGRVYRVGVRVKL